MDASFTQPLNQKCVEILTLVVNMPKNFAVALLKRRTV